MGRKQVSFGTSVSRAILDDKIPNSVQSSLTRALFEEGGIPEYMLEGMINSVAVKAERMYAYGRDHYVHGLPSGQFTVAAEDITDLVKDVLFSIEDAVVEIDYLHHGPANNLHIAWVALMATHGYNPATNQLAGLTVTKGSPVYLHDLVVVVPAATMDTVEPDSLLQWGIAARAGYTPERATGSPETRAMVLPLPIRTDPDATTEFVRVEYVWQTVAGLQRESFDLPIAGFDDAADYFHVRYRIGSVAKYWMYREGAGTHSTLDALFDKDPLPNGSFFPFAYFRYNKQSEISNKTTDAYKTSKKLVKYLGMDYDAVAEAIDSNPGIDDVEQAMLMMAVPANTTNELEIRYLWDFFNRMFLASSTEFRYRTEDEAALYALEQEQLGLRSPGIVIQDTRFKMSLDNRGIYKRRKAGNLGPVGTCTTAYTTRSLSYPIIVDGESPYESVATVPINSHIYRKQISFGYYDEIQVVSLRTLFNIQGESTSIADEDDTILLVPLDKAITSQYKIPDREILYSRAMHFVFNSLIITKVKWYQTGLFQFVLLVVAVVITVYSFGADGGSAIAAALAVGAYGVAVNLIIMAILEALILKAVFRLFVKEVGIEAAFIIAIVIAAVGISDAMSSGSVAGAPYASDLLTLSSNIATGIGAQIQVDMQDLLKEASELAKIQKEDLKLIDTAKELLENDSILSPFVIFGEKPQEFYNRTVHSGNIGVVGISAISSFVGQALKLPELKDSIGEYEYV